ncbi:MAG: hypothetical protein IPG45_26080 [Deltaproteobacteria bacterium]|nr:hypothetical protein [Deltaproteobacteria bacterium]
MQAVASRRFLALAPLFCAACWSPEVLQAPPVEASILLFVEGGTFQGVTQGGAGVRASVAPPALLLGYKQPLSQLGISEGPLALVAEGDELPSPDWAYRLEQDGWREATQDLRGEDLYRQARVQRRSICSCAAEGSCFDDSDPPSCQQCPTPDRPAPPNQWPTAQPASCPERWTPALAPGEHFERCEPPALSCAANEVMTASECRSLIVDCADGFPAGDFDSYVRPGSGGDGSRAAPFGDLDAARAAAGAQPARIALAAGSYQLPDPYRGPALELYACDPRQARLGPLQLESSLRLEGVGFEALRTRRAQLQLARILGDSLDLTAQSLLTATDVDLGALSVRSSTASGSGWRVRGELLMAGARLEVRDLGSTSLRVISGEADLEAVTLSGGLQVTAPGSLRLNHGRVIGRPQVTLALAGAVDIEDCLLQTDNATITVSRGEVTFNRTWFVGPVVVLGTDSTMDSVVFEVEAPAPNQAPRLFHLRTDRSANLKRVYARGPSVSGLTFNGGASIMTEAWLQNHGGSVISLGNGQLEVQDLRAEAEGGEVTCSVATVTSAVLRGRRVDFTTSGVGLLAQIGGELIMSDVKLVHRGIPGPNCGGPFIPLANFGVGVAAYDTSKIQLSHFEILGFPRGVVLNASGGALEDGRIATPIAFSISTEATEELGLLRGVLVEGASLICEGVDQ